MIAHIVKYFSTHFRRLIILCIHVYVHVHCVRIDCNMHIQLLQWYVHPHMSLSLCHFSQHRPYIVPRDQGIARSFQNFDSCYWLREVDTRTYTVDHMHACFYPAIN